MALMLTRVQHVDAVIVVSAWAANDNDEYFCLVQNTPHLKVQCELTAFQFRFSKSNNDNVRAND